MAKLAVANIYQRPCRAREHTLTSLINAEPAKHITKHSLESIEKSPNIYSFQLANCSLAVHSWTQRRVLTGN